MEEPEERITTKDALNHPLIKDHDHLEPGTKDMVLLPSSVMQLHNIFSSDKYKDTEELQGTNIYYVVI